MKNLSMSQIPCSPLDEINELPYFRRLADKVRLHDAGDLHEDYHANLGKGMDLWMCQFLGVDYEDLAHEIREGSSDEEALLWSSENGVERADYEQSWWTAYLLKRGYDDNLSEHLAQRIEESGFQDRGDIETFIDYIEVDEGRR